MHGNCTRVEDFAIDVIGIYRGAGKMVFLQCMQCEMYILN